MQKFETITDDTLVAEAPQLINDALKTIGSDFAGGCSPPRTCFRL